MSTPVDKKAKKDETVRLAKSELVTQATASLDEEIAEELETQDPQETAIASLLAKNSNKGK